MIDLVRHFYIPLLASTCQSFTELIFYHRCHNQPVCSLRAERVTFAVLLAAAGEKHRCLPHFSYSTSDVSQFVEPICISMWINSCSLSGRDVAQRSWMAGVIRLEGRAFLRSLPLLPSSHPKTDSKADTLEGIKLM